DAFLQMPGTKLELGRACVDKAYRNGQTLSLLWRGIGQYVKQTDAQYLFGSASLRNQQPQVVARVWDFLQRHGHLNSSYPVRVRSTCQIGGLSGELERLERDDTAALDATAREILPPLFQSYLRNGAEIACAPAIDAFMGSTDFLTVLSRERMAKR